MIQAEEALAEREEIPGIVVLWNEEWHRGVVGIAASRLAKKYHRPTLLMGSDGEHATGSGRSVPGVDLHGFLVTWKDRLARFGGHRQAVGLTVETKELEALALEWEEAAELWPEELRTRVYEYELQLRPHEANLELHDRLKRLEPYGEANRRPLLRVGPATASQIKTFGVDHVRCRLDDEDGPGIWAVGWSWASRVDELEGQIEVLGNLEWDSFLGAPSLRLEGRSAHTERILDR